MLNRSKILDLRFVEEGRQSRPQKAESFAHVDYEIVRAPKNRIQRSFSKIGHAYIKVQSEKSGLEKLSLPENEEQLVTIGNSRAANILVKEPDMPPLQCVIKKEGEEYVIIEQTAAYKTTINGNPLPNHRAIMTDNCEIQIGGVKIQACLPTPQLVDVSTDDTLSELAPSLSYALHSSFRVELFDAKTPQKGVRYFFTPKPTWKGLDSMTKVAAVVSCYNEERTDLERTLRSLYRQSGAHPRILKNSGNKPSELFQFPVVLIFDGYERMSESMKEYLIEIFPEIEEVFKDAENRLEGMRKAQLDKDKGTTNMPISAAANSQHFTWIIQQVILSKGNEPVYAVPVNVMPKWERKEMEEAVTARERVEDDSGCCDIWGPVKYKSIEEHYEFERMMPISIILKLDNRAKHNSHEWGFRAFVRDVKPEFFFAGDVGTLYETHCMRRLVNYIKKNPKLSAVTGRQRVMSAEQQGSDETMFSLAKLYREAQCYDYESSFASFMAAFSLAGMLPVIPGPCGLYRTKALEGRALDWYFDMVHKPPQEQEMIIGNSLIAEDRILCYAAVLKTEEEYHSSIVPRATFYFEAETELKTFAAQRRRWINGTVACYLFLGLYNSKVIWESPHNKIRQFIIWLLVMMQLLMYALVTISPALFLISLKFSLETICDKLDIDQDHYSLILWGLAILSYVGFVVRHRFVAFDAFAFYWMMFINTATIILAAVSIAFAIVEIVHDPVFDRPVNRGGQEDYTNFLILIVGTGIFFPMLISLVTGGKSIFYMLKAFIPFYLFLPTMVATFGAYSVARTFDLSWGNRPASDLKIGVDRKTEEAINKAKTKLQEQSIASCGFILLLNLVIVLIALMSRNHGIVMLAMGIAVFLFSHIQMVLSWFWFIMFFIWVFLCFLFEMLTKCLCCMCQDQPDHSSSQQNYSKYGFLSQQSTRSSSLFAPLNTSQNVSHKSKHISVNQNLLDDQTKDASQV